jgi:sugar/nucleoside kinase (ribokinase family)
MADYGNRIVSGAGLSINIEMETVMRKLGGNGPIFALGLINYGVDTVYIGCVGESSIDPVFNDLTKGTEVITLANPGRTDAIEFDDGKIISGKLTSINKLSWESITKKVTPEAFAAYMDKADLISFNNWTMILSMNDIWKHILGEVVPLMREPAGGKVMFFDFADPAKRTNEDLLEALGLIKEFKNCGFDTVLGLNRKEAGAVVCAITNSGEEDHKSTELRTLCELGSDYLGIDCLVVHPVENAACIKDGIYYQVEGPYCEKPVLTTGAGDNFNAGFVYGYVNRFGMEDCLLLGTMSSGFYVRKGRSADNIAEILSFIEQ